MGITSESLSFALDEIVGALAFDAFYEQVFHLPEFFAIRPSSRRRERFASVGGLGLWTTKLPGQKADEDTVVQQWEQDAIHVAKGKVLPIERELIDDNEFGVLEEYGRQIGDSCAQTMEVDAAEVYNDLFAGASFKSEDKLTVCNAAHLNVDGGNSQSNVSTTNALDTDGLTAVRTAMRGFKNSRGLLAPSSLQLVLVPSALETTAAQLAKSALRPEDATNADNVFRGLQYAVWDFLSSAVDWLGIDLVKMRRNVLWLQRIGMEVFTTVDLQTGTQTIGGYIRYSRIVRDWRWVYGNNL